MTEQEEYCVTEEDWEQLKILFPDPLGEFPKECVCGGKIWPIYEDNPHAGSYCTICD